MRLKNIKKKLNGEIDGRSFNGGHKTNGRRPKATDPLVTCRFSVPKSTIERAGGIANVCLEAKLFIINEYSVDGIVKPCLHNNVTGSDGLCECLDCGVRNY